MAGKVKFSTATAGAIALSAIRRGMMGKSRGKIARKGGGGGKGSGGGSGGGKGSFKGTGTIPD